MRYDKLWEIVRTSWPRMTVEHAVLFLAIGALVVAAVLIGSNIRIANRMRTIETKLGEMQKEIATVMQVQVALMTRRNAQPRLAIDPCNTAVEMGHSHDPGLTASPPPTPAQSEGSSSPKLPG